MIFTPRKKIITSPFRQRGNIVSFVDPLPPPPSDQESALNYVLDELSIASPGGAGTPRLDMQWRPDGLRVFTCRQSAEIAQNDVSPAWSIVASPTDWSNFVKTANINNLRSIWWNSDGTILSRAVRIPSFNTNITVHDQSATPFDLTVLGSSVNKTFPVFPALSGGPADHVWSEDGLLLWLDYSGAPHKLYEFSVTVPFDITTLVTPQNQDFDFGPDTNFNLRTFAFANDGTFLFAMDGQFLVSWDLPTPFDIGTATNFQTGPEVPAANLGIPRGLAARSDNTDLSVQGDQNQKRIAWFRVPGPPPPPPQANASEYFLNQVSDANPGVGGGTRLDVFWKQDGTKVWTGRQAAEIRQFDVSPPWGIDSGDWTLDFTTANVGNLRSIWWSPDGTVFAHCQRIPSTSMRVTTFDQSATPFDLTVLGASTTDGWTPTGGVTPQDIIFSPDGKRLWVQGPIGVTAPILEFELTVGYDMTTLNRVQIKTFTPVGTNTLAFSEDGTKLYMMIGSVLNSYDMSIPFDIDTLTDLLPGPSVLAGDVQIPRGLTFREDNEDIFVAGDQNARKCAFFRKSTAPKIDTFSFDSEADLSGGNRLSLNGIFITDDGLHLYCCRSSAVVNDAFWFEMSSAHDLSTISFTKENNADGQNPRGIFVRQDGSQLFILFRNATNPDGIFRWSPLSTPFDITTKGARTTLTVEPPGSNNPSGLHFKPDGFKVYITDITANVVLEFTLGTAFDMTTGSHTGTFDTSGEVVSISDLTMDSTGTKMYVLDRSNNEVEQFNLSIPFDIDSAGASGVTPLVVEQGTGSDPTGVHLTDNDSKLYVVYDDSPIVELYTL